MQRSPVRPWFSGGIEKGFFFGFQWEAAPLQIKRPYEERGHLTSRYRIARTVQQVVGRASQRYLQIRHPIYEAIERI